MKKENYFYGKKVTCMGLGLLGGMLNDAIFLLKNGADLTITDLKSEEELSGSIKKLQLANKEKRPIKFVFGRHEIEDFQTADLILQPGNVPLNSSYLLEAQKNNIPIHESESLFFQYLPKNIKTIGVTGTRGKTTTTHLIYEMLKLVYGRKVHLAGNIQGQSTLALLSKIKPGDFVVLELDSWCLHGMGGIKKSPNIAVFTNFLKDHLNFYIKGSQDENEALDKYFTDKAQIYFNQDQEDFLICGEKVSARIGKTKSQKIVAIKKQIPRSWRIKIPGDHNLENIACAIKVGEVMDLPTSKIKKAVENFSGVEGRLQLVKNYKGIKIYNDTTATTPDATMMALRALGPSSLGSIPRHSSGQNKQKKIVLILGGADKGLDMSGLLKEIPKYTKNIFLLDGTGSVKLNLTKAVRCSNLKEAVLQAVKVSHKGDILLFSPAFASFGMFMNEYDRGDKFNALIKALR